ncbi:MAG: carboxypeptidase-like regulatory domain-containing protein [Terracidiphilus sp.]|nr:carboxypeptidase-like regulatory domain-containing protein [Terracidiphilus sp.]
MPDAPQAPAAGVLQAPIQPATGSIHGVVVDREGAVYEGAQVALSLAQASAGSGANPDTAAVQATRTDSYGRFSFSGVSGGAFRLTVGSAGFATQVVTGTLEPGESYECEPIVLVMSGAASEVRVAASREEIAVEQFRQEETQHVLGVLPNFYVSYVPNAPPLTAKQKFHLAWRSAVDPMNFVAVGAMAGMEQATNSFSGYGQGAQGYGKRFGALFADSATDNFIGGALLSSWWKQDPRYFYKGTGSVKSRVAYAIANSVMCRGDNGKWQVDYSAIVGGLASAGISNAYYPEEAREGAGPMFENMVVGFGSSAMQNLFQEFLIRRLTPKVPNYGAGKP